MKIETVVTEFMESNCYILVDEDSDKCILIDPGGSKQKIQQKLNLLNVELKGIINTHGHIDHIACDKDFDLSCSARKEFSKGNVKKPGTIQGLPIWIHQKDVPYLKDPIRNLSKMLGIPTIIENPIYGLKHNDIIKIGNLNLEVIHTPGHTPGSICLKINRVVFTGDTLFYEGIGRTDFPNSSLKELKQSVLKRLFVLDNDVNIYPGHGPRSTIGHEKKHNPFFKFGLKNK